MKAIEWFSGIGGLRLALEAAGHEVGAAVESDEAKRHVYAHHFPGTWVYGDAFGAMGANPSCRLWAACAAPKLLAGLLARTKEWGASAEPDTLWLTTAPQDVSMLRLEGYERAEFIRHGRVHVVLSREPFAATDLADGHPIHKPDARRMSHGNPYVLSVEEAEEAQGFPCGWTGVTGASDVLRRQWLAASEHVTACAAIAARFR